MHHPFQFRRCPTVSSSSQIFTSAAHTASAGSAAALRPLWQGMDRLILNGDVAEIHHPDHWSTAAREVIALFDACEEDQVELTLLSGNHDPFLTDLRHLHLARTESSSPTAMPCTPPSPPGAPPVPACGKPTQAALTSLPSNARHSLEAKLAASQQAGFAEWPISNRSRKKPPTVHSGGCSSAPGKILQVLRYWQQFPALAARFAEEHCPNAEFIIVGHTHHAGIWRRNQRTIINTGSFGFPGKPWAVIYHAPNLTVHTIHRDNQTWRLNESPGRHSRFNRML